MDVSKLPKLSDTRGASGAANPSAADPVPAEPLVAEPLPGRASGVAYAGLTTPRRQGVGAGVWISTVVGLLFLSIGFPFAKFAVAKLAHRPFDTGYVWPDDDPNGRAGQPVAYFDLQGYTAWTDMGMFLFGLTLMLEAASMAAVTLRPGTVSRGLLVGAMGLTAVTVLLNLYVCILVQGSGTTPLLSGLAVAFGGWVLYDEWQTLRSTSETARLA